MNITVAIALSEVGWKTTIQDLGRVGTERLGVPRGGAADQSSARVANILVGNAQSAPLIESLGGALAFTADHDLLVGVTGAVGSLTIAGCVIEPGQPLAVPAGAEVRIECDDHAARFYVAINGAIQTDRFLASAAPDLRMGFAQALNAATVLSVETSVTRIDQPYLGRALFRLPLPDLPHTAPEWVIDLVDCAETDDIPGIRELLASAVYTVDGKSDHVGVRLQGPVLHPQHGGEILSHGVPIGAVEIPHSDELIVLGRYRTLTAGYPIVGFATRSSQDLMGQARPGRALRFRWVTHAEARAGALRLEADIAVLEAAAANAFAALELDVRSRTLAAGPLI